MFSSIFDTKNVSMPTGVCSNDAEVTLPSQITATMKVIQQQYGCHCLEKSKGFVFKHGLSGKLLIRMGSESFCTRNNL